MDLKTFRSILRAFDQVIDLNLFDREVSQVDERTYLFNVASTVMVCVKFSEDGTVTEYTDFGGEDSREIRHFSVLAWMRTHAVLEGARLRLPLPLEIHPGVTVCSIPRQFEDPSEEMKAWLHTCETEWHGDDSGLVFCREDGDSVGEPGDYVVKDENGWRCEKELS